ncbi:hypothetical protein WJX72_003777 [[Myrmecia] bisecta]|uniref:Myb-like domain-containing protein n=1 Tax=[Myrmecia] bisecta TaxID=41462 RepID=A0AAW1QES3_9CHLO
MGRLREKRSAVPLDKDAIQSTLLVGLAREQDSGQLYYGEWVYPAAQRARTSVPNFAVAVAHLQQGAIKPPPPALDAKLCKPAAAPQPAAKPMDPAQAARQATRPSSSGSGTAASTVVFSDDETKLVHEARRLGKSWAEIGKMLGHSASTLRRHFNIPLKVKASVKMSGSKKSSQAQSQPSPEATTGLAAHQRSSLEGFKFYGRVDVVDADDPKHTYRFDLDEPQHCACFNVGIGLDGSPLISWSDLHTLYQMPDGTKWAEHGHFHDSEDLDELCRKAGKDRHSIVPKGAHKQELFKKQGRFHSRLQNIEYECWVYPGRLPPAKDLQGVNEADVYFWRTMFDHQTMQVVPTSE